MGRFGIYFEDNTNRCAVRLPVGRMQREETSVIPRCFPE